MSARDACQLYKLRKKAKHARIYEHFKGLHPGILAWMTDKQIDDLLLHARDSDGHIVTPRLGDVAVGETTLEGALRDLDFAKMILGDNLGNYEEAKAELYVKFGKTPEGK